MQRIELDFIRRAPRSRWAGRVLLAVALGVAGDMAFTFAQLQTVVKSNEALVARAQPRKAVQTISNEELALARDTVERLGLPWTKLFAALESAANDQVALLAIEPDTKNGTVKITGDSKDYLAALGYVLNLSQADALSNVQLVRHEVKQNDPQRPVAFSISAAWNEVKR
ncbi:MAG: PilN domain-containing protein [Betaproteobacteria bacterium]|nr:MAG: PilN domain-containing protein [Betaproteobacteria bacterium]